MFMRMTGVLALVVSASLAPSAAISHNNPSFEMAPVAEIPVEPIPGADGAHSAKFEFTLPPKTIQLHYEVVSDDQSAIRFSIAADGEVIAGPLEHGGASKLIRAGGLSIVDVSGSSEGFIVRVLAEVLVRKSD